MIMITQRVLEPRDAGESLVLPFDMRSRSRFRARLASGEEVGVVLERGHVLRGGDLLLADDGRVVRVAAAQESVSTLRSGDARQLAGERRPEERPDRQRGGGKSDESRDGAHVARG